MARARRTRLGTRTPSPIVSGRRSETANETSQKCIALGKVPAGVRSRISGKCRSAKSTLSASKRKITMIGNRSLFTLYLATALGVLGASSAVASEHDRGDHGGYVVPGSLVGLIKLTTRHFWQPCRCQTVWLCSIAGWRLARAGRLARRDDQPPGGASLWIRTCATGGMPGLSVVLPRGRASRWARCLYALRRTTTRPAVGSPCLYS